MYGDLYVFSLYISLGDILYHKDIFLSVARKIGFYYRISLLFVVQFYDESHK